MSLVFQGFIGIADDQSIVLRTQDLFNAQQKLSKKWVRRIRNDNTHRPGSPCRQASSCSTRPVLKLLDGLQYSLACLFLNKACGINDMRNGGFRDPCPDCHIMNGRLVHWRPSLRGNIEMDDKSRSRRKKTNNKPVAQPVTQPVCYIISKPNFKSIGLMKMSQNPRRLLNKGVGSTKN